MIVINDWLPHQWVTEKMLTFHLKYLSQINIVYAIQLVNICSGFQKSAFKKKGDDFDVDFYHFLRVQSTNSVEIVWELPAANSTKLPAKTAREGTLYNVLKAK